MAYWFCSVFNVVCRKRLSSSRCRSELIKTAWVVIVPGQKMHKQMAIPSKRAYTRENSPSFGTNNKSTRSLFPLLNAYQRERTVLSKLDIFPAACS